MAKRDGFIALELAAAGASGTVRVLIAPNTPSDRVRRAQAWVQYLRDHDIPSKTANPYRVVAGAKSPEQVKKAKGVTKQGLPVVFVNGYAKSKPRLEAVKAVYEDTR